MGMPIDRLGKISFRNNPSRCDKGDELPVHRFRPVTKDFPAFGCDAHIVEPARAREQAADRLTRDEPETLKSTMGFDAEERLIQELPYSCEKKAVWCSRYPRHGSCGAWGTIRTLPRQTLNGPLLPA